MSRLAQIWITLLAVGTLALFSLARLNDGTLLLNSFEGDALHMALGVLRMHMGQVPHLNFMTPLGLLTFAPMSWLMAFGGSLGWAFAYAPVLIGLLCVPALVYVVVSRLPVWAGVGFVLIFMIQLLAMTHGGDKADVAVSMYYNNWAWALSSLAVVTACVAPTPGRRTVFYDGLIVGLLMAVLVLTKMTYAVYLVPAICLGFVLNGRGLGLVTAGAVGVVTLMLLTAQYGFVAFWVAYFGDIMAVLQSELRPKPGLSLAALLNSGHHLIGVIIGLVAVLSLRQARRPAEAVIVLALVAGWFMITHQNWQNDPHWMMLAGILVVLFGQSTSDIYNRFGWRVGPVVTSCGIAYLAIGFPLTLTQAQSLLLHESFKPDRFTVVDLNHRDSSMGFKTKKELHAAVMVSHPGVHSPEVNPTLISDQPVAFCQRNWGILAELEQTAAGLKAWPEVEGKSVFWADFVNALWLFGDFLPVPNGAPWFYGADAGLAQADYLVLPVCPSDLRPRKQVLDALKETKSLNYKEIGRTPVFVLLKNQRS